VIILGHKHFRSSDIYDMVASNIKKCRKDVVLTQEQVAELTRYSHEFIRHIEAPNFKKNFTIESVYLISKAQDINISELFKTKKSQTSDFFFSELQTVI
jgi:transcriptional regulator with XRE-family HTH domain